MADENIERFKELAVDYLKEEVELTNQAKALAGAVAISTGIVSLDSAAKLVTKPARGAFKSIQDHLTDLDGVTNNLSSNIQGLVNDTLADVINSFGQGANEILDTVDSAFLSSLSVFASNKSAAYGVGKNATKRASAQAKLRIDKSTEIINLINSIAEARQSVLPNSGTFIVTPKDAAEDSKDHLTEAKGIIQIVSRDLSLNPLNRKLFTYDRALERISEAIDDLKIGANNFKISEYLQLKAELTVAIADYVDLDLEINTAVQNFVRIEEDYQANQDKVGEAENAFIARLLARLTKLIDNIDAVLSRGSDELTIEELLGWSREAVNIYSIAHQVFDREIAEAIEDTSNEDKQQYDSTKIVVESIDNVASDVFLIQLQSLPDLYLGFLLGRFSEAEVSEIEDSVKDYILDLVESDQGLVVADSGYNPTSLTILTTLLVFADRAGLDQVSNAILTGDLGGILGGLTAQFGSRASEAAAYLGSGINNVTSLEDRQFLQNVNATIQGIQKNRQLAGSTRENAFKKAEVNLDNRIKNLTSQQRRLENLKV